MRTVSVTFDAGDRPMSDFENRIRVLVAHFA